jgi:hypothetical protein
LSTFELVNISTKSKCLIYLLLLLNHLVSIYILRFKFSYNYNQLAAKITIRTCTNLIGINSIWFQNAISFLLFIKLMTFMSILFEIIIIVTWHIAKVFNKTKKCWQWFCLNKYYGYMTIKLSSKQQNTPCVLKHCYTPYAYVNQGTQLVIRANYYQQEGSWLFEYCTYLSGNRKYFSGIVLHSMKTIVALRTVTHFYIIQRDIMDK